MNMLFDTCSSAQISPCGLYRYTLTRSWGDALPLTFVMLNPSTADAAIDDPTIRRCIAFARRDGFGGIRVLNLFAYRSPYPSELVRVADPVGPDNDRHLATACGTIVAAWGAVERYGEKRIRTVAQLLSGKDVRCLGTTKSGQPRHPLYVKGDSPLTPFTLGGAT